MKVYFLSYNIMNNSTGDYFIALSNKLSEDNKVVVFASKIRKTSMPLNDNVQILQWPSNNHNSLKDFFYLVKMVQKYKPDAMLSIFSFVNLFLIVGALFGVKTRIAWIRTLSSQLSQTKYKVLRKSFIYKLSTHIITNSMATKNDVIEFFKIPESKITVLPNAVKDVRDSLATLTVDPNKLLYVGRLHPSKGIDVLIFAFSKILDTYPTLHLEIIGQGALLNELCDLTSTLNISDKVSFLGEQQKNVVLKAYKTSYCTVIPSNSEAFGYTVIEAMSVGTCVIGANNTGIKEIIKDKETGLLFETGDSEDLAKKLCILIEESEYRNRLADAGYNHFMQNYENTVAIERDSKFFESI